ncbi:putative 16S rRNA-processing protein rimM [Candidatus Glomeribacter gigasporarum BEG34]|uniref:Ribosome maturation factor RimM n=1 Tax=Candidatus Glomeribacter gigasporarum BEG34 TaxID=1070319 RepID=G2J939_9BURK|nr:ribosome maturation factor RimM [Candidatus Glomeribacter gigasporarum]CCD29286.1 putative 16S rRNA-processing protein rimM [Candidatus Glomeribacter gigasporarum BEG34]
MNTTGTRADRFIEVGRITGAYGIRGWVKVKPYAARHLSGRALLAAKRWQLIKERPLRPAQHSARAVDAWTGSRVTVLNAKPRHDALIAQFAECAERETALTLKGGRVFVRRADFLELPKDEYYWTDLIGLQVINTAGEILGIVRNLLDHGAHAVLCVEPHASNAASAGQNRELLIPFVNAYILEVDLGHHQMIVDWRSDWDG